MGRRIYEQRAIMGVAFSLMLTMETVVAVFPEAQATADERPNILVFVTDDQRLEGTMEVMPQTRSWFSGGGTWFPNGFVTTPLCCPARSTNFSGRYAHNHGVLTNDGQDHLDMTTTVQRYLHDAGYSTAYAGKFLNFYNGPRPPNYFDRATLNESYLSGGRYNTAILGDRATTFLSEFESEDDRPWMLFVAPKAPHAPYKAEPQYETAPVPARTSNPALLAGTQGKAPNLSRIQANPGEVESVRVAQLRTLMSVDDMVQRIMSHVQTLGEDERTLAFFLSDNGFMWGEFGLKPNKKLPYAPSVRVPFFMRWPGHVPAGATDPRIAANVDLAPTLLEAAGVPPPTSPPMDGVSLLQPDGRERLTLEYFVTGTGESYPEWGSTITQGWQYIEWYGMNHQDITFREYYDLNYDPWQVVNILADGDPQNDPDLAALSQALAVDRVCAGQACTAPAIPDVTPPGAPTGLSATDTGAVELRWTAPSDDVGVTGYEVWRDGGVIATVGATPTYSDAGAPPSGGVYDVVALDRAGNHSEPSASLVVSRERPVLFEDGFETGTMSAWSFAVRATPQQQEVAVGAWALGLLAPRMPAYAQAQLTTEAVTVELHLRFLLRSKGSNKPVVFARLIPSTGPAIRVVITYDGKLAFVLESTNTTRKSTTAVTAGVWHELEFTVRTGPNGWVTVRMDGLVPPGLNRAEATGTAPVASLQIGDHTAGRTYDLIVDDVRATSIP